MTDYTELVNALRCDNTGDDECGSSDCTYWSGLGCMDGQLMEDAADAIEALQAETERLTKENRELYLDRPELEEVGRKWVWRGPKRGEWIKHPEVKNIYGGECIECPFCGEKYVVQYIADEKFCRNCGADMMAEMEVQDGE